MNSYTKDDKVVEVEVVSTTSDVDTEQIESQVSDIFNALSISKVDSNSSGGDLVKYDPLKSYLNEIKSIPRLNREEEKALAIRFKERGDKMAGYKLILANLRLVVIIVRKYQRNLSNILDLVQEGNLGLMEAVKQFDPYKGVRFSSYAAYWVRAYVLRYVINNVRLVKVGTTQAQRKLFYNLQKEKSKLEAEGFYPEAKLLADRLKVKESEVIEMQQRLALPDLSVDSPINIDNDSSADYHSIIPDETVDIEQEVDFKIINERLHKVINSYKETADKKEIALIERRLFTDEPETLSIIAKDFNLSRERMRQIESALKGKLKELLEASFGKEFSNWSLE